MKPGTPDLPPDLGLGASQAQRRPAGAQPAGEHCQIHHQGDIRKRELAHVDQDVSLGAKGTRYRLPSPSLRGPVLVSPAAQDRGLFTEVDDRGELYPNVESRRKLDLKARLNCERWFPWTT